MSKFTEYIVKYLVKNTDIVDDKINYPFLYCYYPFPPRLINSSIFPPFSIYITKRFGASEDEVGYIWKQYRERLKEQIDE